MEATTEYLSCKETSQLVREALKARWPEVKFSVRSDTYSGGASTHIAWQDGPTEKQVEQISKLYEGASFDGMQDLKSYHSTVLVGPEGPREVHMGADYVFTRRQVSPEFRERLIEKFERATGLTFESSTYRDFWYAGRHYDGYNGEQALRIISSRTSTKANNPAPEPRKPRTAPRVRPVIIQMSEAKTVTGSDVGRVVTASGSVMVHWFTHQFGVVRFIKQGTPKYVRGAAEAAIAWATGKEPR